MVRGPKPVRSNITRRGEQRWSMSRWLGRRERRAEESASRACHVDTDCGADAICDAGRCVPRKRSEGSRATTTDPPPTESPPTRRRPTDDNAPAAVAHYPRQWERSPGDEGFNDYVDGLLRRAGLDPAMRCGRGKEDRLYQRVLAWLVHPQTPIRRLLVAWQLGMGKTIGMLRVLDNFFDEEWPKILLFPNAELVDNFYQEFASTPNRYMRHFQSLFPRERWPEKDAEEDDDASSASSSSADAGKGGLAARRAAFVVRVRRFMEAWPKNTGTATGSGLAAPLRAFTFDEAAGTAFLDNPTLRWPMKGDPGYVLRKGDACFRRTVLLIDEAHNLLHPPATAAAGSAERMAVLRRRVEGARRSVVVLFTATPVLRADAERPLADVRRMMKLVKGVDYAGRGDEGFVSWLMERPPEMFARVFHLRPDGLPIANDVFLEGSALWHEYTHRRFRVPLPTFYRIRRYHPPPPKRKRAVDAEQPPPRDRVVEGPEPCVGRTTAACRPFLANLETTLYADRAEEMAAIKAIPLTRRDAFEIAPKLAAIALSVTTVKLKTLILIHRENGFHTLVHLLRLHGIAPYVVGAEPLPSGKDAAATVRRGNNEAIGSFNAAAGNTRPRDDDEEEEEEGGERGGNTLTLVAAAEDFSEGVSFHGVRRIVLADLSPGVQPPSAALVLQRIGRALRACSHQSLPAHMRTLAVDLFVARHRDSHLPPTIDAEKYDFLAGEAARLKGAMEDLRAKALDGKFFAAALRGESLSGPPPPTPESKKKPKPRSGGFRGFFSAA